MTAAALGAIFAVTMNVYKTTVRFNAEELKKLRRAAGDANLTRYVKIAALRDADRKIAEQEKRAGIFDTDTAPTAFHNPPPFGAPEKK